MRLLLKVRGGRSMQTLNPVSSTERYHILDVLRGFALIGILFMNIEWFGRALNGIGTFNIESNGLDHAASWLVRCFVEGKFYKLFSLLFGMGFAVMILRARSQGRPFSAWFVRRMIVLYIIGMLHMVFLWGGDILHDYAFAGLLFLGLIRLLERERFQKYNSPPFFLKLGLIWLLLPIFASVLFGIGYGAYSDPNKTEKAWQEHLTILEQVDTLKKEAKLKTESEAAESDKSVAVESDDSDESDKEEEVNVDELSPEELIAYKAKEHFEAESKQEKAEAKDEQAYGELSYKELTKYRSEVALERMKFTPFFSLILLLPIFILGYWLIVSEKITKHRENKRLFKLCAYLGTSFGMMMTVAGLLIIQQPEAEKIVVAFASGMMMFQFGQLVLTVGYLGLVVMWFQTERGEKALSLLIPMGRMALTNYIMHSVILSLIFHGYAGGLYGEVARAPQMTIAAAIIIFQIFASKLWLQHYRFGPLEWVWRCLSYMKFQPMKH